MQRDPFSTWRLAVAAAIVLVLALAGGAALGHATAALAAAAVLETVALLSLYRHRQRDMMRRMERELRARHDRFMTRSRRLATQLRDLRSIAGSLPDAVVLLDHEGRVRWFNRSAERLLGLRRPKDRGAVLTERMANTQLGNWLRDGGREPVNDLPGPVDSTLHLNALMIPLGAHQRLLMIRDISNLSRLERVRRDFVANVSHELRTPLTVIHGYLELLEPEENPELADVIKEMRAQSKRMGQIVEDLLTLSRLETQERLPEEHVAMAPLLATLRKEAEALSQGRHKIDLDVRADCDLLGSTKELHSAFSNLVSNAVRYTPTGGRITIRWHRHGEGVVYAVSDTGFGIPEAHIARLTERFYRVSSSRSRETGGTGLGLSIVKHVLSLHDGRLSIRSEPGKGSTFACEFDADRIYDAASADED